MDYYVNEYRFKKDDLVNTYTYVYTTSALHSKVLKLTAVKLLTGYSGVAYCASALIASIGLLAF